MRIESHQYVNKADNDVPKPALSWYSGAMTKTVVFFGHELFFTKLIII